MIAKLVDCTIETVEEEIEKIKNSTRSPPEGSWEYPDPTADGAITLPKYIVPVPKVTLGLIDDETEVGLIGKWSNVKDNGGMDNDYKSKPWYANLRPKDKELLEDLRKAQTEANKKAKKPVPLEHHLMEWAKDPELQPLYKG